MKDFFQVDRPVFEASAPGRIDVMGGVADYSGGLVLQMPIPEKTTVRMQLTEEDFFTVVSEIEGAQRSALVEIDEVLSWGGDDAGRVNTSTGLHGKNEEGDKNLGVGGDVVGRVNTSTGLHLKNQTSQNSWTRYILGGFLLASKEFGFPLKGARVYVTSDVPFGAGLSSSAAL